MKNKTTLIVSAFLLGLLIGCAACWCALSCCKHGRCSQTCGVQVDSTGIDKIEVGKAGEYFSNYMDSAVVQQVPFKAFAVNKAQFNAMKLLSRDTTVHGFRIYMGRDEKGNPVRLVVGTGSPDQTDEIYLTTDANSGPCPDFCDDLSQITHR